jgi:hypothetical protein
MYQHVIEIIVSLVSCSQSANAGRAEFSCKSLETWQVSCQLEVPHLLLLRP